jgi:hypothetical protein
MAIFGLMLGGICCVSIVAYLEGGMHAVHEAMWSKTGHRPDRSEVLALSIGGGAGLGGMVGLGRWLIRATGFLNDDELRQAFGSKRLRQE